MDMNVIAFNRIFLHCIDKHISSLLISHEIGSTREERDEFSNTIYRDILFTNRKVEVRAVMPYDAELRFSVAAQVYKSRSGGSSFGISDYMVHNGIADRSVLAYPCKSVSFHDGLNAGVSFIFSLIGGQLRRVIDGSTWEDIPFDWMGYK